MIRFAEPWLFSAGAAGSLAITALHFLSSRRPPELWLPTARFLEEGTVRAVSRTTQPSDITLLVLRVMALLCACAAMAGPRWTTRPMPTASVVVADVAMRADSTGIRGMLDQDAANGVTRFVWSDSIDASGSPAGIRSELAAALPLARRAATLIALAMPELDSIALYVVVPAGGSANLNGWHAWRRSWPAGVRILSLAVDGDVPASAMRQPQVRFSSADVHDPVRAALALRIGSQGAGVASSLLVHRGRDPEGPSGARADAVTIVWPIDGRPAGWVSMHDTVGAVVARGVAMVGAFARTARPGDRMRRGAVPIAWWSDGEVAAVERTSGDASCVREVAIPTSTNSDMLLDPSANGLLDALLASCARSRFSAMTLPADTGGPRAMPTNLLRADVRQRRQSDPKLFAPALFALALLFLTVEWRLRDRSDPADSIVHA